jgi:cardiolipin synthase
VKAPWRHERRRPAHTWAWPAGIAAWAALWYASDSLRHRREQGQGYQLRGEQLDVHEDDFLHAAEALTGATISVGNDVELFVNGDRIFPVFLDTIREARRSVNLLTYVYWQGEIAHDVAGLLCERARDGIAVNVLLDWVGSLRMDQGLIEQMRDAGVSVARFRPPKPYAVRRLNNRTHRKLLIVDGRIGMTGGRGDRRGVDRRRAGSRPLARHPCPGARARGARPAGRVRRELARGDR